MGHLTMLESMQWALWPCSICNPMKSLTLELIVQSLQSSSSTSLATAYQRTLTPGWRACCPRVITTAFMIKVGRANGRNHHNQEARAPHSTHMLSAFLGVVVSLDSQ